MPSSQLEQKQVYGLALQSNSFNVPEGSYEKLDAVVIGQDGIIKKKRGASLFYALGGVSGRSLVEFFGDHKLLGIHANTVQVYTQASDGSFSSVATLGGSSFTIDSDARARNIQANGNLYFTANEGVFKIESTSANVLQAGIKPATDLQIFTLTKSASETFFRPDAQISYRILFGRKDANNNTVIGAPSQIVSSTNTIVTKSATNTAGTVVVTDASHTLSVNDVIYVVNAVDTGIPDGNYTVTAQTPGVSFTFVANTGTGGALNLSYGTFKTPTLEFAVPSGLSTEYFARIYRSDVSAAQDIPADESTLQLVDEFNLSSGQISTGFVIYKDETPDILKGAYLYTNPNTGEARGIAAANEQPPQCADMAIFKGTAFFANIQDFYSLSLGLLASNSTDTPDAGEFTITSGVTTRTYVGALDPKVGNRTVRATSASFLLTDVTINYTGHGFSNGDTIAIAEALDSSGNQLSTLPQGNYTVSSAAANSFHITAPATPTGLTTVSFAGISNAAGKRFYYIENSATTSVAAAIANTARAIVRAINRDSSAPCYGYYVSTSDGIPGQMVLRSKLVTTTFHVNATTAALVTSFNPNMPTSGSTLVATRDDGSGVLGFSKPNEQEACPLANRIPVGGKASPILRIMPLRDSLIIMKSDGVYRLNGDDYTNFSVTILDSTIFIKASDSVSLLNNRVFGLADQGVVAISETAAQIVSRAIEPVLTAIAGNMELEENTHGIGYESERLYILTTIDPATSEPTRVYVYNHLTSAWSTWNNYPFFSAYIKPFDNKLYYIDLDNQIFQERKNQNRLDFTDQSYSATVATLPDTDQATLTISGGVDGEVGDVVVFGEIISRITGVSGTGASAVYTFLQDVAFDVSDSVTLYKAITSEIRNSPFFGGIISNMKQFSEFQAEFRNRSSCSALDVYFLSDQTSSGITEWTANNHTRGWGYEPWGSFPWGMSEGIDLPFETFSAGPMRMYVPLETQRGLYIQADITHSQAAEDIMLQNMAFTARMYKQRTTK